MDVGTPAVAGNSHTARVPSAFRTRCISGRSRSRGQGRDRDDAEQQGHVDASGRQPRVERVAPHDLDVRQARLAYLPPNPVDEVRQRIHGDDLPGLADHLGGGQREEPGAASDFQNRLPRPKLGAPQRPLRIEEPVPQPAFHRHAGKLEQTIQEP